MLFSIVLWTWLKSGAGCLPQSPLMRKPHAFLQSLEVGGTKIKAGQVQLDFPVHALADSLYLRSVFPGRSITLRKPYLLTSSSRLSKRRCGSSFRSSLYTGAH